MTAKTTSAEPSPALEEAKGCTLTGPPNAWFQHKCNANGPSPRACARLGCPHHVHSWARVDARYCSGTCRMAVLRAERRRFRDDAEEGLKRRARKAAGS